MASAGTPVQPAGGRNARQLEAGRLRRTALPGGGGSLHFPVDAARSRTDLPGTGAEKFPSGAVRVRGRAAGDGNPTGSGKTLASVKIALERAIKGKKKRIIYIIPYNSIIDQTAEVFGNLFRESLEILRHQSTFSYEDEENGTEDYREAAKTAAENWDSPFVITTAVQFFESVYANKRGKERIGRVCKWA